MTLILQFMFSLDPKKYSSGAVAWERRSCLTTLISSTGSIAWFCLPLAFQNNYRGNIHSVCNFNFSSAVHLHRYTPFLIRNSFIRNLYWNGQIAKKLSVLKPQRLRNFYFFALFFFFFFIFSIIILKTQ